MGFPKRDHDFDTYPLGATVLLKESGRVASNSYHPVVTVLVARILNHHRLHKDTPNPDSTPVSPYRILTHATGGRTRDPESPDYPIPKGSMYLYSRYLSLKGVPI